VVTVTRIDQLARSTFDLFAIVKQIVDAGGQFLSLAEPWADTATSTGGLMIAVLGGLARRSPRRRGASHDGPVSSRSTTSASSGGELVRLRREQRQAAVDPEQPALFELREDCRPAADYTAAGRYLEPTLFTLMERQAALLAEREFSRDSADQKLTLWTPK